MKIIGIVKENNDVIMCKKCNSAIEYSKKEIIKKDFKDYDGSLVTWNTIECPNCNNTVKIGRAY